MLKRTISYVDYDGNERTEDFYFNLTKAELTELEFSEDGGLIQYLRRTIAAQDGKSIIKFFKDFVLMSYGEKSPDGRRFIKNDDVREAFAQTEAYSELFMELATDDLKAIEFVNGVMPKDAQMTDEQIKDALDDPDTLKKAIEEHD